MGTGATGETAGSANRRAKRGRVLRGLGAAGSAECAVGARGRGWGGAAVRAGAAAGGRGRDGRRCSARRGAGPRAPALLGVAGSAPPAGRGQARPSSRPERWRVGSGPRLRGRVQGSRFVRDPGGRAVASCGGSWRR